MIVNPAEAGRKVDPGYAFEAFVDDGMDVFDELELVPSIDPLMVGVIMPTVSGDAYNPSAQFTHFFTTDALPKTTKEGSSNTPLLGRDRAALIIASPTALHPESPDCIEQAKAIESKLYRPLRREGIAVVEFTRQPVEELREFLTDPANLVDGKPITHPIVSVSEEIAEEMGAVILPRNGATPEYWGDGSKVTARTLTVATPIDPVIGARRVVHRERKADQGSLPNLVAARTAARRTVAPQR